MRVFAVGLILAVFSIEAFAQLDRLFFSQGERASMDSARSRASRPVGSDDAAPTVDGLVRRSDGNGTIWINGRPYPATDQQVARATTVPSDHSSHVRITVNRLPDSSIPQNRIRREARKP